MANDSTETIEKRNWANPIVEQFALHVIERCKMESIEIAGEFILPPWKSFTIKIPTEMENLDVRNAVMAAQQHLRWSRYHYSMCVGVNEDLESDSSVVCVSRIC